MITPYESADGADPRFLHLYEMNSADPEATFSSMRPLVEKRLGPTGSGSIRLVGLARRVADHVRQHLRP